jgi:hypothetical protein
MARKINREAEQALLQALACGATVEQAARKAGIGERTAYRRLGSRAFRGRLREARLEIVQRTAGLLTGAGLSAVKVLIDLQQDVAVSAGVRRRAARDVLDTAVKLRDSALAEERLAAVETRLEEMLAAVAEPRANERDESP